MPRYKIAAYVVGEVLGQLAAPLINSIATAGAERGISSGYGISDATALGIGLVGVGALAVGLPGGPARVKSLFQSGRNAINNLGSRLVDFKNKLFNSLSRQEIDVALTAAPNIARGHAFEKHVLGHKARTSIGNEFAGLGISTTKQLETHVIDVIQNTTQAVGLPRGRTLFASDKTNTIVISNPNGRDGGTVFRLDTNQFPSVQDFIAIQKGNK